MNRRSVRVHIGTLVLEGLPLEPAHGAVVEGALREELERLLREGHRPPAAPPGEPGHPLSPPPTSSPTPSVGAPLGAASLGRALAGELHREVHRRMEG